MTNVDRRITSTRGPLDGAPASVGLLVDMASSCRSQHLPSLIYITENADADDPWNPLTSRIQQEGVGLRAQRLSCNSTSGKGDLPRRRLGGHHGKSLKLDT